MWLSAFEKNYKDFSFVSDIISPLEFKMAKQLEMDKAINKHPIV